MKHTLLFIIIANVPALFVLAAPNATPILTEQKALETARTHIIDSDIGVTWPDLGAFETVELNPKTWGERYWAFRFPGMKPPAVYYVNKESGFVQSPGYPKDRPSYTNAYKKKDAGDRYLFTIIFDPDFSKSGDSFKLIFRIAEDSTLPHPEYYYREYKNLVRISEIQKLHSITVPILKDDLKKYEIIDPIIVGPGFGMSSAVRIGQVPDE
jgi:hypothetical protein